MPILSPMMHRRLRSTKLQAMLVAVLVVAASCGSASGEQTTTDGPVYGDSLDEFLDTSADGPDNAAASSGIPAGFTEIQWESLIPPGSSGDDVSARYEERIDAVEFGTPEADELFAEMQAEYAAANDVMNSDLSGEAIQLAGFVAPITYVDDVITEFLLVPYFGACIHVPPPPPNQTVLVTLEEGQSLSIDDSWGAVWVTGTLDVETSETDLATAGYTISAAQTGVYNEY